MSQTNYSTKNVKSRDLDNLEIVETYDSESLESAETYDVVLTSNNKRFVLFPIKHKNVWDMYKKHEGRGLIGLKRWISL